MLAFIGKVLLVILYIILFLILLAGLVLFVPIRYKIYLEKGEDTEAKLRVSWLLRIIYVSFYYKEGEPYYKIRLFGIDVIKAANLFKRRKKKDNNRHSSIEHSKDGDRELYSENTYENNLDVKQIQEKSIDKNSIEKEITDKRVKNSKNLKENIDKGIENLENTKEGTDEEIKDIEDIKEAYDGAKDEKRGIIYKLKEIPKSIQKCIDALKEAKDKLFGLKDKAADIKNKVSIIKEFIFSEYVKGIICIVHGNVLKLLKKIKPKKLKSDIIFGLGDPCLTGEVLGGIAVFMAITGIRVNIVPDFERQVFEGKLEAVGKIRLFTFIRIALGIIISKEWKSFYKEAMRIKEEL